MITFLQDMIVLTLNNLSENNVRHKYWVFLLNVKSKISSQNGHLSVNRNRLYNAKKSQSCLSNNFNIAVASYPHFTQDGDLRD